MKAGQLSWVVLSSVFVLPASLAAAEASASAPEPAPIVLARDPTLSPSDLARLAEASIADPPILPVPPVERPRPRPKPIVLEAIIRVEDQKPRAIVNGELVMEGDRLGPVKVLSIGEDRVLFLRRGKRFVRTLEK